MVEKFRRVQSCHLRPLLDDVVDRLWIKRTLRDISQAINRPEHTATFDPAEVKPGVERVDRPPPPDIRKRQTADNCSLAFFRFAGFRPLR